MAKVGFYLEASTIAANARACCCAGFYNFHHRTAAQYK